MNNNGLIYAHINKINGAMYIGQTFRTIEERCHFDGSAYRGCEYFYNAIQKYGWDNFDHIILENDIPIEELNNREKYWIEYYHTCIRDPLYEKGYNLTKGGGGTEGKPCSDETKKKISKANSGKKRTPEMLKKLSEAHIGNKASEETKKKMSKARTGKHDTELAKQHKRESFAAIRSVAVQCVETGVIFSNYKEAADWLKCSTATISNHINNPLRHKTIFGYSFIRVSNP